MAAVALVRARLGPRLVRLAAALAAAVAAGGCAIDDDAPALYYAKLENLYKLTGRLRTETDPPDAPFTDEDLVRNFERIAFHTEFSGVPGALVSEETPHDLLKWTGPITYQVVGEAATDLDRARLRELTAMITAETGLAISETRREPDIMVLFAGAGGRNAFMNMVRGSNQAERMAIFDEWSRNRDFPCVGQVWRATGPEGTRLFGMIAIKGEMSGTLRHSCIHEEFVQTLGLTNDHPEVRPSIFNDDQEFALLTEHDLYLLRILYDPRLRDGMGTEEAMPIVRRIVRELRPGG